jgi:HEAT repeat protein
MIQHKKTIFAGALALAFAGAIVWGLRVSRGSGSSGAEPVFRGQPESYWVTHVSYRASEAEIKQWREFGPEGVRVLIRGLERANPPGQRAYRKAYRQITPHIPGALLRRLPAPKLDTTIGLRMNLIDFLSGLGSEAAIAEPAMARALRDESASVRQLAISYFTSSEDEKARLNQLDPKEKRRLLPEFIRALEDQRSGNWGLRNNGAVALRYYPEQRQVVGPALVKALKDPVPAVRLMAAVALYQIDPEASKKAGAASVMVPIAKDRDDQVASRAAQLLGKMTNETEVAVPALVEALENTNTLVACYAVWAFEWGEHFNGYGNVIVPALSQAAQRPDNVGGYARAALKQFASRSAKREN